MSQRIDEAMGAEVLSWMREKHGSSKLRIKAVTPADPVVDDAGGQRLVAVVISKEVTDRDGEVVKIDGLRLDNFRKTRSVFWNHDISRPVATSLWEKPETARDGVRQLVGKARFSAKSVFSREVYGLIEEGILQGVSLGLLPNTMRARPSSANEKAATPGVRAVIESAELIEYSFVGIPSCPEALVTAVQKGLVRQTLGDLERFIRAVTDANPRKKPFLRVVAEPACVPTLSANSDKAERHVYHEWALTTASNVWRGMAVKGVTALELRKAAQYAQAYEAGRI